MNHNFITDYTYYFSNDECHPDFHFWSCLTLLGHVIGRRIWVSHGRFVFYPNLYVLMVGTAGSGKSTAYKEAMKLYIEVLPELPLADSIQSREDIIAQMVDECVLWKCPNESAFREYHPFFILTEELADFISVNPVRMLGFLVGVFDASYYSVGFKKDKEMGLGKQRFKNPHVSVLACAQPEWFMDNVKIEMFKRGLGRRCIILYRKKIKLNPEPFNPPDSLPGWLRVKAHLARFANPKFFGEVVKTPDAQAWYNKWHMDKARFERYEDIMLKEQLLDTQHVLLHKIAMLYACCRYDFGTDGNWSITQDDYEFALKQLHYLEPDVVNLMKAGGKNEMAPVAEMMLQSVNKAGGWMLRSRLLNLFYRQGRDIRSFKDGIDFLHNTNQMYQLEVEIKPGEPKKWYAITPLGIEKLKESGINIQIQKQ